MSWNTLQNKDLVHGRRGSVLDRRIPLGMPVGSARTEIGPSASSYYAIKHASGVYGTYFPLHKTKVYSHDPKMETA